MPPPVEARTFRTILCSNHPPRFTASREAIKRQRRRVGEPTQIRTAIAHRPSHINYVQRYITYGVALHSRAPGVNACGEVLADHPVIRSYNHRRTDRVRWRITPWIPRSTIP